MDFNQVMQNVASGRAAARTTEKKLAEAAEIRRIDDLAKRQRARTIAEYWNNEIINGKWYPTLTEAMKADGANRK